MQTDPNWSNFFYDPQTHRVSLSTVKPELRVTGAHRGSNGSIVSLGGAVGLWCH